MYVPNRYSYHLFIIIGQTAVERQQKSALYANSALVCLPIPLRIFND
jgi:hypothetical protein